MNAWNLGAPPVEGRLLGLDRGLIAPTLVVVGITLLLGKVIPMIDAMVPADAYPPGAIQEVHHQVQFSPAPGWIPDGVPAPASPELTIFKDGVSFTVASGAWNGGADELLDSILESSRAYQAEGDRRPFELPSGMQGVALHLFGVEADGALFALVAPDAIGNQADGRFIGVRIVVRGPPDVLPDLATDIGTMLRSFAPLDIVKKEAAP